MALLSLGFAIGYHAGAAVPVVERSQASAPSTGVPTPDSAEASRQLKESFRRELEELRRRRTPRGVPPTPVLPRSQRTPVPRACDPSYPGVCIPPNIPDLDCADIPYLDFAVTGEDAHGFDGDNDGWGCESKPS